MNSLPKLSFLILVLLFLFSPLGTTIYPTKYYNIKGTDRTKHIFAGDVLITTVKGSGASASVHSVYTDYLTGSNAVVNSSGNVEELMDYYPFGEIRLDEKVGSFSEQSKLGGQEYDEETGLSYMNARYYDGMVGRFVSQDPVHLLAGDRERLKNKTQQSLELYLSNPQNLNSYAYVNNNPLTYTDPTGEFIPAIIAAAGIAYAAFEVGSTAYDGYVAISTWLNKDSTATDKAVSIGMFGLGLETVGPRNAYKQVGGKIIKGLDNAKDARNISGGLSSREIAEQIAGGHAYSKHIVQKGEFKGLVNNRSEFASHIENVINNPSEVRYLEQGRTAYWSNKTDTLVIHDPRRADLGTAYQPSPREHGFKTNYDYFKKGLR